MNKYEQQLTTTGPTLYRTHPHSHPQVRGPGLPPAARGGGGQRGPRQQRRLPGARGVGFWERCADANVFGGMDGRGAYT